MGCCSGDLFCCSKVNRDKQFSFLQGLLSFLATTSASASQSSNILPNIRQNFHTFIPEYGFLYFVFSAACGALVLLKPLLMVAYQISGLGITYRVLSETINTVLTIYSQALAGYLSDRWKSKWGQRKPVIAIGIIVLSISSFMLSLGVDLNYRLQACFLLLFSATSSIGEAFFTTCTKSWLFEITSGQDELLRSLNYYSFPGVVVGFLVMAPFTYISDLRFFGVLIAIISSLISTYALFSKCRIGDNRKPSKQEAILATVIKLLSNPFTEYVWIINLGVNAIFGFLLFSTVITLNYTIIKNVADTAYFGIGFGIGFTVFFCIPLNYVFTERINGKQWRPMSLWESLALWSVVAFVSQFAFAATLNYRYESDIGAALYTLTTLMISCLLYLMQQVLVVVLRKGCMVDLMVRGINSFSQYNAVIGMAGNIINVSLNAVVFVIFSNIGYSQNDDDSLDDKVSERYDFTDEAMWYLIAVTTLPPAMLCLGIIKCVKEMTPLYNEIDTDRFESESEAGLISLANAQSNEDKKAAGEGLEEALINSSQMDSIDNGREEDNERIYSRVDNVQDALLQFTENELSCLSHPDTSKRDTYKSYLSSAHHVTLIVSIIASITSLYFTAICIMKGYPSVTIIVFLFVLNSLIAFYETLKHKSLTVALPLYGSKVFDDALQDAVRNRSEFENAIQRVFPIITDKTNPDTGIDYENKRKTHMTTDKTIKTSIALFSGLSSIVLVTVIINYS